MISIMHHTQSACTLLKALIAEPSFSKAEDGTATIIEQYLQSNGVSSSRIGNNIIAYNKHFRDDLPTLLLNSHHDTVKPAKSYTRDPFAATVEQGKLYGLGSNDAGGCLVSLLATFTHYYDAELPMNIAIAATAEEEISGTGGIEMVLPYLHNISCAIVGEPTLMQMAIAERGLMVVDAYAAGKAGHAARNEGVNALYIAVEDIAKLRNFSFDKASDLLGDSRLSVTVMETENKQHNVVPSQCHYVIDFRLNELCGFEEVLQQVSAIVSSELKPRSMRLRSTLIPLHHPLVEAGRALGLSYYGSPTTSDKALMPFPALKMGPGDSARSHMADEFIFLDEIEKGIAGYIQLIDNYINKIHNPDEA